MMRIAIPTTGEKGLDDIVSPVFGRAPFFTFVDLDDNGNISNVFTKQNPGSLAQRSAGIAAAQTIISNGANVVIAQQIGPNSFDILRAGNIKILSGAGNVKDVVERYKRNELPELAMSGGFGRGFGRGFRKGFGRGGFGRGRWR